MDLKQLKAELILGQHFNTIPEFFTIESYQMFMDKYVEEGKTPLDRYSEIAAVLGKIATELYGFNEWDQKFFDYMWKGWLSPSTPLLANLGTNRGMPVSCSGQYVDDSIFGFYSARMEAALLTQNGFGTSAYMGGIRPRGSAISRGGKANGALPVFTGFAQDMKEVSQGGIRRGSWAGYIEVDHPDFDEVADYLERHPDGFNVGWIFNDGFIERLQAGDKDALERYKKVLKIRLVTGRGYMYFADKVNRQNPPMYTERGLRVLASNLCTEVALAADQEHTFTCVLSSLNVAEYDEWKDTNLVEDAIVFLDCVCEAFIRQAEGVVGLENAVRFTKKSRALGLGALGFHTYLQEHSIPFESMEAHMLNANIFKTIRERAQQSSEKMASIAGEPEWCEGYGVRNTHLMAVAPNMSTAIICGGVSQGIEPIVTNVYTQNTAAGEMLRVNPTLRKLMEERGVLNKQTLNDIIANTGSVQHVDWLNDHEKEVFRTAFEIDQYAILRLASSRQRYIDQAQSINLFFSATESPKVISDVHKAAMLDPYIKSLYYLRSQAGVKARNGECTVCEG